MWSTLTRRDGPAGCFGPVKNVNEIIIFFYFFDLKRDTFLLDLLLKFVDLCSKHVPLFFRYIKFGLQFRYLGLKEENKFRINFFLLLSQLLNQLFPVIGERLPLVDFVFVRFLLLLHLLQLRFECLYLVALFFVGLFQLLYCGKECGLLVADLVFEFEIAQLLLCG